MCQIIDFAAFVQKKKALELAVQQEREAELARRAQLEIILTDLLAELEAA